MIDEVVVVDWREFYDPHTKNSHYDAPEICRLWALYNYAFGFLSRMMFLAGDVSKNEDINHL
jgi:hypothetical protein